MRQMIIRSENAEEDKRAALFITEECERDRKLKKITWYSNIATLVTQLEKRFDAVDKALKSREKQFEKTIETSLKSGDRLFALESDYKELKERVDDLALWVKEKKKADKQKKAESIKKEKAK